MKVKLELNFSGDRIFLNFWNGYNGEDFCCQLVDGKLMLAQYDENGNEIEPKEITLPEFVAMVKEKMEFIIADSQK